MNEQELGDLEWKLKRYIKNNNPVEAYYSGRGKRREKRERRLTKRKAQIRLKKEAGYGFIPLPVLQWWMPSVFNLILQLVKLWLTPNHRGVPVGMVRNRMQESE